MNILYGIEAAKNAALGKTVVTAGTFDGVHQGHILILNRLIAVAKSIGGTSVVITYEPHPRQVLEGKEDIRILSTLEEKIILLQKAGIDCLLVLPFTKEFSQQSSTQYIQDVLQEALRTQYLVIGYDHKFGRNREGSFSYLLANGASLGFEVIEIPRHDIDTVAVSSTKTRHALQEGDLRTANLYLNRFYTLTGTVVKGQQLGRTLGYPTANLFSNHDKKLIPAIGVYAVWAILQDGTVHKGALSIGVRPVVNGKDQTIEVYLLDFSGDLYGQTITLEFVAYLRNEWSFDSLEALKNQIAIDVLQVREILDEKYLKS